MNFYKALLTSAVNDDENLLTLVAGADNNRIMNEVLRLNSTEEANAPRLDIEWMMNYQNGMAYVISFRSEANAKLFAETMNAKFNETVKIECVGNVFLLGLKDVVDTMLALA